MTLFRWVVWQWTKTRRLRREVCKRCFRENPVGFRVPDEVWAAAVPERYRDKVLCIFCFDDFATRRGVDWSTGPIEFWPVSGAAAQQEAQLRRKAGLQRE